MMVRKIFFDMDGVLADFDRGIRELCGIPSLNQEAADKAADERMWAAVRDTDHFYDRLELMPGAEKMFRLLYKKYGSCCEILTAIPKAERGITSAGEDKIRWVRRLLSENIPVHIVYKEEKKNYCTGKDCILIDDYSTNIKDWEAFGGTGILFKNAAETLRALRSLINSGKIPP